MLIPQVWETCVSAPEGLALPHYTSPHPLSQLQPHTSLHPASQWHAGIHSWRARQRDSRVSTYLARLGTPPPRPVACCVVLTWSGRVLTSGRGRGCAGAVKGAGDSACCVAAGEPETVLGEGPQVFQPPDNVVSLSRTAAALAQQQQ